MKECKQSASCYAVGVKRNWLKEDGYTGFKYFKLRNTQQ